MTVARLQLWSSSRVILRFGVTTTWGTVFKGHSVTTVENHWLITCFPVSSWGHNGVGHGGDDYYNDYDCDGDSDGDDVDGDSGSSGDIDCDGACFDGDVGQRDGDDNLSDDLLVIIQW